jgi:isovaleryl-CoA dehydrogenase
VADVLLVYAKTNRERGAKGISAFIVEKDMPGFSVAQKLTKMGFRGSQTGELVFDDCRVPAANLVGEEDQGVKVVMSGLDLERAMISPLCLGIAERALELSLDYARERRQFGRPIADFQMIRAKLADMYVWVEAMRLFTYQALRAANDLEIGGGGRGSIHRITAASVMFTAETMNRVLNEAVQIHGGSGYIWESEVNRLYRAIKLLEIGAGTTEVRKIIISDELLRA